MAWPSMGRSTLLLTHCLLGLVFGSPTDDYIRSLAWPVSVSIPQVHLRGQPNFPLCKIGLVKAVAVSIGLTEYDILNDLSAVTGIPAEKLEYKIESAYNRSRDDLAPHFAQPKNGNVEGLRLARAIGTLLHTGKYLAEDDELNPILGKFILAALNGKEEDATTCDSKLPNLKEDPFGALKNTRDMILGINDLITGVVTGRATGEIFNFIYQLKESLGALSPMKMTSPMKNLGQTICNSLDVSRKLDIDPGWLDCVLVTLISAVEACPITTIDCQAADNADQMAGPEELCDLLVNDGKTIVNGVWQMDLVPKEEVKISADGEIDPDTIEREKGLYTGALFMAFSFQEYTHDTQCLRKPQRSDIILGWERTMEFWQQQEGSYLGYNSGVTALPTAVLLHNKDDVCDLTYVSRGTWSDFEGFVDFNPQTNPIPGLDAHAHRGFMQLSNAIMPSMLIKLEELLQGPCPKLKMLFTGISQGGAMSILMALRLALYFESRDVLSEINVVALMPAKVLDQKAMDWILERANMRLILNELDIIPGFPCANREGLPRCDNRKTIGLDGTGLVDIPYAQHPNRVPITPDKLAEKFPEWTWWWADKDGVELQKPVIPISVDFKLGVPANLQAGTEHVCAYACYITSHFCTSKVENLQQCFYKSSKPCPDYCNPNATETDPDHPDCPPFPEEDRSFASLKCNRPHRYPCAGFIPGISGSFSILKPKA